MAVAFDAKSSASVGVDPGTSISSSAVITVGSGSNRALVVMIDFNQATLPAALSVAWGAQTMTQITGAFKGNSSAQASCAVCYGLVAPTSGAQTLAISWTGSLSASARGVSFTGVDQTGGTTSFPNGNGANSGGTPSNPATVTITTTTSDAICAVHVNDGSGSSAGITTSGTTIETGGASTTNDGSNYSVGVSTTALTCTFTASGNWASAGTSIKAVGGGDTLMPMICM